MVSGLISVTLYPLLAGFSLHLGSVLLEPPSQRKEDAPTNEPVLAKDIGKTLNFAAMVSGTAGPSRAIW
jgi:hypothetical protein